MTPAQPDPRTTTATSLRDLFMVRLRSEDLELPILPETAASVLEACRDEATGPRQVAETLQRDSSLAGHVLRLANSAAYGGGQPIASLSQAVSRLGLNGVAEITMAIALKGKVFRSKQHESLALPIWIHSAAAGGWAREIARMRRRNVEGAFLCGLLHDVGRPVILQAAADIEAATGTTFDADSIRALMDEFHTAVGSSLIRRWSLPDWIADAVLWHHDYAKATNHRNEVLTTALADRLAHWSLERAEDDVDEICGLDLVSLLNIYPEDLEALFAVRPIVLELTEAFA